MANHSSDSNYFGSLTGVRAVAAYMVFFHHYTSGNSLQLPGILYRLFQELHTGVTIFFVLSGFLITCRYYDNFRLNRQWMKKYIVNRVARIYPMYFLLTALTFITIFINTGSFDLPVFLANITFLRGFFDELKFTGIAPGWSLTVEEVFYFSAPFIFLLYSKKVKIVFIALLLWAAGFLIVALLGNTSGYGFMATNKFMLFYTFFGRCAEFFIGAYVAFYLKKQTMLNEKVNKRISKTATGGIGFCIVLMIMVAIAMTMNLRLSIYSYAGIFINNLLLPACIAIFFTGLLTEKTFVKRLLQNPLLQLLGKSSYVFYLIHMGVISAWLAGFIQISNGYMQIAILFILLNIISIVLYKMVEEPLNKYLRLALYPLPVQAAALS